MAYVNGTTHYNLPQTVGTDKRDWADTNQAFADVDAALFGAVDDVAQAQTEIDALTGRMNTAEENITDNTADIAGLDTRLTTAEGAITSQQSQITDMRQDMEDMVCAYNEASATSTHAYSIGDYFIYNDVLYKATQVIAIGDTIVPDTNCATTNVATELLSAKADIASVEESIEGFTPESMIAQVESTSTSTHNYALGNYLILNDVLYTVIAPISIGDTINVGVNVVGTTVTNFATPKLIHTINGSALSSLTDVLHDVLEYIVTNINPLDVLSCFALINNRKYEVTMFTDTLISIGVTYLASDGTTAIRNEVYNYTTHSAVAANQNSISGTSVSTIGLGTISHDGSNIGIYL